MELLIILIIIIALWVYILKQPQSNANKEQSKPVKPDIFSNISEWNNDKSDQEPPKFQIDQNFFTIDGLDRFFDSVIDFIKTGKLWELVHKFLIKVSILYGRNGGKALQEKNNFNLVVVVIIWVILFFWYIFFALWVLLVIAYFLVKLIKLYRDKNPWFRSTSSPVYAPQYTAYSENNEIIYWDKNEIWLHSWFTDKNHIVWIIWLLFLVIINNRQFDSDGGASILDLILVDGTYPLLFYWFIRMVLMPLWKISQLREAIVFVLKNVWKYLWYLFLFLIITAYIVYKFFLPSDIQKEIEHKALLSGFYVRLWPLSIDSPKAPYDFWKDVAKHCTGYVHTEICEAVLADILDSSINGRKSLYEYCVQSVNVKKEYCSPMKSYMKSWTITQKLPEFKRIFNNWMMEHSTPGEFTLGTNNSEDWYATTIFLKAHCLEKCSQKPFNSIPFGNTLLNSFDNTIRYGAYMWWYDSFTIWFDSEEVLDNPEKLVEILNHIQETIANEKEKSIQSAKSPEEIDTETEQELRNLINNVSP